jgi:hypothetical protein
MSKLKRKKTMKNLYLLVSLILIIALNIVSAQDRWIYYSDKPDDEFSGKYYYDKYTIEYFNDNTVSIWIKFIPAEKNYSDYNNKYNDYSLMQFKLLCGERKYILVYAEAFYTDGSNYSVYPGENRIIRPESHTEVLYFKFCK